jgi:hypothetical protein
MLKALIVQIISDKGVDGEDDIIPGFPDSSGVGVMVGVGVVG